ncbi:MAG: hypothetical protein DMF57_00825 [Acidobacteria bacterium]|nr:MAG: hypothetical protein DMF57_00825 [Acidobacteriota bacterium]
MEKQNAALLNKDGSAAFYDARYSGHYMEEWPEAAKARVFEVIRTQNLPNVGQALDFGCGSGVMTEVLRQALGSGWTVFGCDVSSVAISKAAELYPHCTFFQTDDPAHSGQRFDFLFTHHVLEHVYDLRSTVGEINSRMKPASSMLHILPCGNEGSFEQRIASMRSDGIDPRSGNRFFFEDEGHVRRLTSDDLAGAFSTVGFRVASEFFRNQYHGAIDWISSSPRSVIRAFLDLSTAREDARSELERIRWMILLTWLLRYPSVVFETHLRRRRKNLRDFLLLAATIPLYPFSKPAAWYLQSKANHEWHLRRTERNGSEMFVFLKR